MGTKRTLTHIVDSRSVRRVLEMLPDHWVIRDLTERDYGIDLMVEIFAVAGIDSDGHEYYHSSGSTFHIQVKGTSSSLAVSADGTIHYQMPKNALLYAERFSTPFFLFRVDVSDAEAKSYFIWVQRYIQEILDAENPYWRDLNQNSFVVRIPEANEVRSASGKIEKIAARPKVMEELLEFRQHYAYLADQLDSASKGQFTPDKISIGNMKFMARRIASLSALYSSSYGRDYCIDEQCAKELKQFVDDLDEDSEMSEFSNHPHDANFALLAQSVESMNLVEKFIADNEDETVY